ncbi:Glycosyl-hydrolase 97 C-terminal, oligomerisation [Roseateles sp. YR242]|uniref:glycoside hydrolase family 97 catalytic domain-containing protein n=1 Tax=Roseateles sp. YR242 TaxID=1855305 RepID=UPI0008AB8CD2|nr:glycoside hydrolase family 97 catalytic domain-containing protein [Roseateles sp. YR242]SEL36842.1 Glycosyl-hydrolase 97 C-terminal, oligomerisation [Roseateles sp. YR242]
MRSARVFALLVLGPVLAAPTQAQTRPTESFGLGSPHDHAHVSVQLDPQGRLIYYADAGGAPLIEAARLGLRLKGAVWDEGLKDLRCGPTLNARERYALIGKRSQVDNGYRARTCAVSNPQGQVLELDFRAFDDGVAFRYRVAGAEPARKQLVEELTSFRLIPGRAWMQPMQVAQTGWMNTNPAYEEHYRMDIPVGETSPSPAGWVFPALFRLNYSPDPCHGASSPSVASPGCSRSASVDTTENPAGRRGPETTWVVITEAGLDGTWQASRLQAEAPGGEYRIGQPMPAEVFPGGGLLADVRGTLTSPWRVISMGALPTVMTSTLGTDLAAPAIAFPADRLQPGPASWSWALLKDDGTVYDVQKRFIDYAADMHWPYTLIDADWDRKIGWKRMEELVRYAQGKGVGLWLWYNSSGSWNKTTYTPKSRLLKAADRRAEFKRLRQAGVKGLKIDFFGGDGQSMIQYYVDIMKDAAAEGLLLNFHGATLPRGWARTFPNLMTTEAVKGFEFTTFEQKDQDAVVRHLAMLPFARNLYDPMDFTPLVFGDIPNIQRATTNGFELALSVLLLSSVQHYAETPEGMAPVPTEVKDFLRELPRRWDDVRFLGGEPGRWLVLARRAGDRWVVAGINADDQAREIRAYLPEIDQREGRLIISGEGPRDFDSRAVAPGGLHLLTLGARGGFVATFR